MEHYNQIQGKAGEAEAKAFLQQKGFRILEERYRSKYGEIDLIALKKHQLLFVEVKWRSQKDFGDPYHAITPAKIRHLKRAAHAFLWDHPYYKKHYSFHLAAVAVRPYLSEEKIQLVLLPPEGNLPSL